MVTNRISRRDSFWWGGREVYEPSALGGDRRGRRRVPEDLDHSHVWDYEIWGHNYSDNWLEVVVVREVSLSHSPDFLQTFAEFRAEGEGAAPRVAPRGAGPRG